jgi:hypothetical protein
MITEKEILDTYWPVIEKAIEVEAYYMGRNEGQPKRVCSDVVGSMIIELNKARKVMNIERIED